MTVLVWNVLLVDDNPQFADLFRFGIEEAHLPIAVHAVHSALDAMNFLAKKGSDLGKPTPDLIISDLNMPRISGLQLLQLLKSSPWKHLPVLILSTTARPDERESAMALGAVDFWTKESLWEEFLKQLPRLMPLLQGGDVEGFSGNGGA